MSENLDIFRKCPSHLNLLQGVYWWQKYWWLLKVFQITIILIFNSFETFESLTVIQILCFGGGSHVLRIQVWERDEALMEEE